MRRTSPPPPALCVLQFCVKIFVRCYAILGLKSLVCKGMLVEKNLALFLLININDHVKMQFVKLDNGKPMVT